MHRNQKRTLHRKKYKTMTSTCRTYKWLKWIKIKYLQKIVLSFSSQSICDDCVFVNMLDCVCVWVSVWPYYNSKFYLILELWWVSNSVFFLFFKKKLFYFYIFICGSKFEINWIRLFLNREDFEKMFFLFFSLCGLLMNEVE